jgi:hypothetical protein
MNHKKYPSQIPVDHGAIFTFHQCTMATMHRHNGVQMARQDEQEFARIFFIIHFQQKFQLKNVVL